MPLELFGGGSCGIRLGIVQALLRREYSVTLVARDRVWLREWSKEPLFVRAGQKRHSQQFDMQHLKACANFGNAPTPPLDYQHYVNCAGVAISELLVAQPLQSIEEVLYRSCSDRSRCRKRCASACSEAQPRTRVPLSS